MTEPMRFPDEIPESILSRTDIPPLPTILAVDDTPDNLSLLADLLGDH